MKLDFIFTFQKCDTAADCKNPGLYCDAFFGVCKKLLDAGETCTQKDQCNSKGGKYRCTWGRCIANSDEGSPGLTIHYLFVSASDNNSFFFVKAEKQLACHLRVIYMNQ